MCRVKYQEVEVFALIRESSRGRAYYFRFVDKNSPIAEDNDFFFLVFDNSNCRGFHVRALSRQDHQLLSVHVHTRRIRQVLRNN